MASKDMKIMIAGDQVMYSNISKSKDGYNSARVVAKINEKEYMSVSYEWEGDSVPEFAMSLMGFMQANELELGTNDELAGGYDIAAAKKGKNPFVKKDEDMEDEEEDPKKKKDNKDSKKKEKKEKSGEGSQVHCKNCKKTKDKCDCGNWQPVPYKTKDQKENKTK